MTVADLDSRLSSSELAEWIAYESISGPLGRRRNDIQAATIAATIANANRGKKGKKFKLSDFLIPYGRSEQKSPEQLLAAIKSMNKAMGGEVRG